MKRDMDPNGLPTQIPGGQEAVMRATIGQLMDIILEHGNDTVKALAYGTLKQAEVLLDDFHAPYRNVV